MARYNDISSFLEKANKALEDGRYARACILFEKMKILKNELSLIAIGRFFCQI